MVSLFSLASEACLPSAPCGEVGNVSCNLSQRMNNDEVNDSNLK